MKGRLVDFEIETVSDFKDVTGAGPTLVERIYKALTLHIEETSDHVLQNHCHPKDKGSGEFVLFDFRIKVELVKHDYDIAQPKELLALIEKTVQCSLDKYIQDHLDESFKAVVAFCEHGQRIPPSLFEKYCGGVLGIRFTPEANTPLGLGSKVEIYLNKTNAK